jgi:hypothetical protein
MLTHEPQPIHKSLLTLAFISLPPNINIIILKEIKSNAKLFPK